MFRCLMIAWLLAAPFLGSTGCQPSHDQEVVVYTALDQGFSEPIFQDFQQQTGIVVRAKFDTESTKSVGLAQAILSEAARPRCDLFWNNEILHTLRLESAGLLDVYFPDVAQQYPAQYRSPTGTWHGFAARARVLIVNTRLIPQADWPHSIHDLGNPRWQGKCGLAKPLFGTTATHAACLFARWGDEQARQFFDRVQENAAILSGNKQVAVSVGTGQLAFGLTDTDDAMVEIERGMPVQIVYPDQHPDGIGTLFIPNTLALVRGGPHPRAARELVDHLLSPQVEERLARGPSAQIPLNRQVDYPARVETPKTIRAMAVDFSQAAAVWETASRYLRDTFSGP